MNDDGLNYFNDILGSYMRSCEKYTAASEERNKVLQSHKEAVELARSEGRDPPDAPQLEELEEPDHHLAKCALDAVAVTSEQGQVRAEVRQKEGMLDKLHDLMKGSRPEIVDGAATALANCSFDSNTRPMMLNNEFLPTFMRAAESESVDSQLAAARALGNFALDGEEEGVVCVGVCGCVCV